MKAYLRKGETVDCVATSPSGKYTINVELGVGYDFMYDDNGQFYLIVDDRLYEEISTVFDFIEEVYIEEDYGLFTVANELGHDLNGGQEFFTREDAESWVKLNNWLLTP